MYCTQYLCNTCIAHNINVAHVLHTILMLHMYCTQYLCNTCIAHTINVTHVLHTILM
jgi:hypothetical protein